MATRVSSRIKSKPAVSYSDELVEDMPVRRTRAKRQPKKNVDVDVEEESNEDENDNNASNTAPPPRRRGRPAANKDPDTKPAKSTTRGKRKATKAPSPTPPASPDDKDDVKRKRDVSPSTEEKEILDKKQEIEKKIQTKIEEEKGGRSIVPVDANCPNAATYTVYCDEDGPWDAMLNQTNVGNNNNKYYLLQLLVTGAGSYVTWFRWGRIGYSNNYQNSLNKFGSIDLAKKSFCKKFSDKTKNRWPVEFDEFEKYSGKYDLIKLDYTVKEDENVEVDGGDDAVKKEPVESKLDPRLLSLMQLISNVKAMENAVMEMNYDVQKSPLGKLSKQQILSGYEALTTIEGCIKAGKTHCREATEACSMFYTRIPHSFGFSTPPMITTLEQVKMKMDLLDTLIDIEAAVKAIKDGCKDTVHKSDSFYDNLRVEMTPLDKESDLFKMLSDYLHNTHGKTHTHYTLQVEDIFELKKEGDEERYRDLGNKQLLWHGSRLTNWGGIFSQGLRIAPPEAPVTGYMFGKGVYFADMASKSANYCFTSRSAPTGILLLCEVSMGSERELLQSDFYADKLPAGKHSTKGLGKTAPAPAEDKYLGDVKVPMGCGSDTGVTSPSGYTLQYNEFIVYDIAQIKMKYALRVKFNYKR